ncbi:DUF3137 domain-containing protein [Chitinophaga vietnamensis]|uniref:DUF3137 domain-containing protein n=1 Tax=Chitinophaga vietnamensis TaxID=2593957 RepID=UPI001177C4C7|nr:DUF3137 domain-containing protein [Chitinophaga vietnamensis]
MRSLEEFKTFVDQHLRKDLQKLEQQRIAGRRWTRWMWVAGILPVLLFYLLMTAGGGNTTVIWLIAVVILGVSVGLLVKYLMSRHPKAQPATDYRQDFKQKVVKPIISFINPDYTYLPLNYASFEEFTESGLFAKKEYNISGNDQVFGKMGNMQFQFCDLKVTRMPLVTLRGRGADTVFSGSYFIAQFPRYFTAPVYILSRNSMTEEIFTSTAEDNGFIETWNLGKKVLPADAAFNREFMVYSSDAEEAQQLLSPALMQRVLALQERSQAKLFISFYSNRIYIGINHGLDYFEADMNQSLADPNLLTGYYMDFLTLLQLVEDLQQNVSIWTTTAFSKS